MSQAAKVSWLITFLCLVIVFTTRFILGGWVNWLAIPLGLAVVCMAVAFIVDFKFYLEFFSMRTTKHGMNMGVMILLAVVTLLMVNFLSIEYNKTWDLTEEKLFSLSPQSSEVVDRLTGEVKFTIFYRGGNPQDEEYKKGLKALLALYQEASDKIKVSAINSYSAVEKASEYLSESDAEKVVVFVESPKRRIRVEDPKDAPIREEQITNALIKATRTTTKTIYFLTGHGERALDGEEEGDLKTLKDTLEGASFAVKPLNLMEVSKVPDDADVLAIIGTRATILETELKAIEDYARGGGKLFIALDPGQKSGLPAFLKKIGVNFLNNYVINQTYALQGRGPAGSLGVIYSQDHEVTKKFPQEITLFELASEVKVMEPLPEEGLSGAGILKTLPTSFTIQSLSSQEVEKQQRPVNLVVSVAGALKAMDGSEDKPSDEFAAIVVGDSDFVSNRDIVFGLNQNLALNSMAHLAGEDDIVSILPKRPKGTTLTMTSVTSNTVIIAGASLPLVLLILSGVFWYRRRGA